MLVIVNPAPTKKAPVDARNHLGIASLFSYLKDKTNIKLYYDNRSNKDFLYAIKNANIVAFTGMTYQAKRAFELASMVVNKKTVFGGPFASMNYRNILKNHEEIDFIIVGEGEKPLENLLNGVFDYPGIAYRINEKIIFNAPKRLLASEIPDIDYSIIPKNGIFFDHALLSPSIPIMFSRGCNGHCTFCAVPSMFGSPILISPKKAVSQLENLIIKTSINTFAIEDDNFLYSSDFLREFCELVRKNYLKIKFRINCRLDDITYEKLEMLKNIGLYKITVGLEHIDENILQSFGKSLDINHLYSVQKWCNNLDIKLATLFIIGSPFETLKTLERLKSFIKDLSPSGGFDFQVLQPHPGTPIEKLCRKMGIMLSDDTDDYFSDNITYIPPSFDDKKKYLDLLRNFTGKKLNMAGFSDEILLERLKKTGKKLLVINPDKFSKVEFNIEAYHWEGSNRCKSGLSIIKCRDFGFIEYEFELDNPENISELTLHARLASHPIDWPQGDENCSDLDIYINENSVAKVFLRPIHTIGEYKEIAIKCAGILKKHNTLRFEIPENATHKKGLSIFYKPLNEFYNSYKTPIILEVKG